MKKVLALILALLMLAAVLSGCGRPGETAQTPELTPEPSPEATPEPTPDRSLSWARAFRDDSVPEGSLSPEEIAFLAVDEEGNCSILNVPRKEIMAWWEEQETLPRTHYFEQFMPEALQSLYPVLDYAMANSYGCFCVPSTDFTPSDVGVGKKCLQWMYRINGNIISAESCGSFDLGEGKTLQYILITMKGMNGQGSRSEYQESIAKAREIVAGIPEGSGDFDKIFYLYNWLTENVVYYDVDDPYSYYNDDWNLLYDTLVKNSTVCAGYAEALYVMCNLADVECFVVMGSLYGEQGWGGHAWNMAKIDGEYYLFDSTWDMGSPPERYCFFGMSDETMQSYYRRLVQEPPEEYRQPCTKDLPVPGAVPIPDLEQGTVEEGAYSQPFADLNLSWDDSWSVFSREEIVKEYYGGSDMKPKNCLRLGVPYLDLVLERGEERVQILLELSPVEVSEGSSCDSPESYMDAIGEILPGQLEEEGLHGAETSRFEKEIGGRTYAGVSVSGRTAYSGYAQIFLSTERDECFLTISVTAASEARCEQILESMLP